MNSENTYYDNLMIRYFTGEASGDEISELWAWLEEHPLNKELFKEQKKIHDAVSQEMIEQQVDLDKEWVEIKHRMESEHQYRNAVAFDSRSSFFNRRSLLRVAAAIILLFSVGFLLKQIIFGQPDSIHLVASNDVIETQLPDGSHISLNKGSSLTYPEDMKGERREVELKGEAHFDVSHNPDKPFIVSAGDLRVEVLGTKFYINTNGPGNQVQVILIEGSVAAYYKDTPESKTILKPGEEASFNPSTKNISTTSQHEEYFLVWKTRSMKFSDERLDKVVAVIAKAYNKKITLSNPAIGDCRLSVAFENQTLESVLKVLESTLGLSIVQSSTGIVISGSPCE